MEKTYECLKDTLEEQVKLISKKGDKITQDEMMSLYYALKSMDKIDELMEKDMEISGKEYSEGYHGNYMRNSRYSMGYSNGYSDGYNDGYNGHMSNGNRSPVTGKYISQSPMDDRMYYGNHMYGHSIKDRMIAKIETMYDEAKSDHEKQVIANTISRIQNEVQ